jgi:hypothetical protein
MGIFMVSLVSVRRGNQCYSRGRVETVVPGEIVGIANIHAVLTHVAEKIAGWQNGQGEYPPFPPYFKSALPRRGRFIEAPSSQFRFDAFLYRYSPHGYAVRTPIFSLPKYR